MLAWKQYLLTTQKNLCCFFLFLLLQRGVLPRALELPFSPHIAKKRAAMSVSKMFFKLCGTIKLCAFAWHSSRSFVSLANS